MNNAMRSPARKCSKGHTMDPNWETCPYCEREQKSQIKSSRPVSSGSSGGGKTNFSSGGGKTKVGETFRESGKRETKAMPSQAQSSSGFGGHVGVGETRRIVGVMITYNWRPEGELFPIREGKNFIGSGQVSSDPSHSKCHIQIPNDARMSSEHALILCRHGMYEIIDQTSSNGTFLNGEMLMSNKSTELSDYAEIKTGNTVWMFIKIKVPETIEQVPPVKKELDDKPGGGKDGFIR